MNFSLILPSRERPELLRRMLQSVKDTVADAVNVDVMVAVDHDDPCLKEYREILHSHPFTNCYYRVFPRQPDLTSYYNYLAKECTGKYLWILNDDCVLKTKGWDQLFSTRMWLPEVAFYGRTRDTLGAKNSATEELTFAMFPVLSRQAYLAQGWVLNPKFPAWGADENLWQIWHGLGMIVDLPMMSVEHVSFHHGLRERDKVSERVAALSRHPYPSGEAQDADIQAEIQRIRSNLDEMRSLSQVSGAGAP